MIRIMLVCSSGMSTSLLVSKMKKAAEKSNIEVDINAIGSAQLSSHTDNLDVVLLGPQVRFMLNNIREQLEPKGVPVDVINNLDYGTMNGEKVLKFALSLAEK
ncbi:PTS sugar transporter subunit IIB [Abyssisolibacter fermentans]|uniref:PTS sugar transporter subunit IIB n=1 Tax=Abyssisolibacter fermentans TaxID=1766203 RepID=UPI00082F8442|nr:PTS sugar transporter subunit IIB [Abyssisolibacter fermentans]